MTSSDTATPGPATTPAAGAADARRRFRLRRRHLIYALVAVAVVFGAILGTADLVTSSKSKPVVTAANLFFQNVVHDDFADAYAELCATTRKQFTEPAFEDYIKSQPAIVDHKPDAVRLATVNGVSSAIVTMELTVSGGQVQPHQLLLRQEGGKWLICGQPY